MRNVMVINASGGMELLSCTNTGTNELVINGATVSTSDWVGTGSYTFTIGGITYTIGKASDSSGNWQLIQDSAYALHFEKLRGKDDVYVPGDLTVIGAVDIPRQTSGNWTYILLGDLFVGWYATTGPLTIGTQVGNVYQTSGNASITLPVTLSKVLHADVRVNTDQFSVWTAIFGTSGTTISYRALSALSRSAQNYDIQAVVVGKK